MINYLFKAIRLHSPVLKYAGVNLENPDSVIIRNGLTCIIGKNGSGKTTLANILHRGRHAYGNRIEFDPCEIVSYLISFSDIYSLGGIDVNYYSQRLESTMNDFVPEVGDVLGTQFNSDMFQELANILNFKNYEKKKINFLSSGELRKLVIIKALLSGPDLLIIDNPYIGLDEKSRADLDFVFEIIRKQRISIIILVNEGENIPYLTDYIIPIENCVVGKTLTLKEWENSRAEKSESIINDEISLPSKSHRSIMRDYEIAFSIRDGHASYPGRVIFDKFNWTIRKGECWALTGPNGSGKSLLLSMICADNPQGYANDIILFDRKRGTGESIWDIKELIGYMSPEMQNYFRTQDSVKQIVLQGLRNSINRFKPISEVEKESIDFWLQAIKISDLADRPFSSLSSGEQRLVLLARALIGQPELLVLDEPFHGLDSENIYNLQRLISSLVRSNRTSLIFVSHHPEEFPDCITHYKSMTTLMKQV